MRALIFLSLLSCASELPPYPIPNDPKGVWIASGSECPSGTVVKTRSDNVGIVYYRCEPAKEILTVVPCSKVQ
jgi:hypothetical protein